METQQKRNKARDLFGRNRRRRYKSNSTERTQPKEIGSLISEAAYAAAEGKLVIRKAGNCTEKNH